MTLLTDVGGRMVFHQLAAKGFNAGRKGVGRRCGVKLPAKNASPLISVPKSQAEAVAQTLGGRLSKLNNGYKIEMGLPECPIVIRLMNKGSGQRSQAYFRISKSGKGSLTRGGLWSDKPDLTHFDLQEGNITAQVQEILKTISKK